MKAISKIFLLFGFLTNIYSQNLEKIGKKDMLKVNGGLNYSTVLYQANGIENRREPFNWFLSGNITASILDINLPFTFNYSNAKLNYTQPVNIQSFNPNYKWIKGTFGITSMNFSSYTLCGHIFTGGGLEITPKILSAGIMYGLLKRAREFDYTNNSDQNMSYKRIGQAAYVSFNKNGHGIKTSIFHAKDIINSLQAMPVNTSITPMENTAVSISGNTKLFKTLQLNAEYAMSGLTKSLLTPIEDNISNNKLPFIYQPNSSSRFYSAYKASLAYQFNPFSISFNYEHVDPGYQTLGAYFFNNDLENYTIGTSAALAKGKLNLNLNTGLQKNNLSGDKLNTTKRWVGNLSASYSPNQQWQFSANYNNFSTFTKQRPQTDPFFRNTLDTLNFYQLNQTTMLMASHQFGSPSLKQSISVIGNYMITGQNSGRIDYPGFSINTQNLKLPSKIINGNLSYNLNLTELKSSCSVNFNANQSFSSDYNILFIGPGITLGKTISQIKLNAGTTYNQVLVNNVLSNEVLNHRLSINYSPKSKNTKLGQFRFNTGISYMQKLKRNTLNFVFLDFSELTANINLNYSF